MTQFFQIHPENPQPRLIARVVDRLRQGAVIFGLGSVLFFGLATSFP